jgi:hypothetical protein
MAAASSDLMEQLHAAMVKALLIRIADGMATAADLGVAAKLLKDSAITAAPKAGSPTAALEEKLAARAAGTAAVRANSGVDAVDADTLHSYLDKVWENVPGAMQ